MEKVDNLRRINGPLSLIIIILFLVHGIVGGLQLIGTLDGGIRVFHIVDRILVVLLLIHGIIGIKLTWDSLSAIKKSGVSYAGENKRFWAVRISGAAIFVLIFFHVAIFLGDHEGFYRLNNFGMLQLILQLLMVVAILIHIICNLKPQLISLGIKSLRNYVFDMVIILSGTLVFAGLAFVVYYMRWAAI